MPRRPQLPSIHMCEDWVAIVDDDPSIRRSLARIFTLDDVCARTFSSAEEYLDRVGAREPCCMVLDVQLGGMNGFELQDHLRAAGRTPPIIFITALDAIPSAQLACRSGQSGFLRKPFDVSALLALVRPHLHGRADFQSSVAVREL
jgi:FixJ family two-component response regulator